MTAKLTVFRRNIRIKPDLGRLATGMAVLAALLVLTTPAVAQIYKCVTEGGHVTFQETTCDGMAPGNAPAPAPEQAWPGNGKHIFWKADSVFGTVYVLGSLHFGSQWMYPLPSVITDALASSDALVVEANVTAGSSRRVARALASRGTYPNGRGLDDLVSPATWRLLENVSRTLGVSDSLLRRQKPWLASMTLTAASLNQIGFDARYGVDVQLMRQVGRSKPIIELESVSGQLEMLDRIPEQDQVAMLMQTLNEVKDADRHFQGLLHAWLNGDADKLDRLLTQGFDDIVGGRRLYQRLIVDRNEGMQQKIGQLIREHDTVFVVVGSAHLVGDDGIIARMKDEGYTLEQL